MGIAHGWRKATAENAKFSEPHPLPRLWNIERRINGLFVVLTGGLIRSSGDALQELIRRFVVWILRYKLATNCKVENLLVEAS